MFAGAITVVVVLGGVYLLCRALLLPLLDRLLDSRGLEAHARRPITKAANVAVVFAGVAVAFGLAMQDVLRNFVAGVFVFTDRPLRVGDWIEWDDNAGVVEDVSFRVTRVRTFDSDSSRCPTPASRTA